MFAKITYLDADGSQAFGKFGVDATLVRDDFCFSVLRWVVKRQTDESLPCAWFEVF